MAKVENGTLYVDTGFQIKRTSTKRGPHYKSSAITTSYQSFIPGEIFLNDSDYLKGETEPTLYICFGTYEGYPVRWDYLFEDGAKDGIYVSPLVSAGAEFIDNYDSTSTTAGLSAAKGKDLNERLSELEEVINSISIG